MPSLKTKMFPGKQKAAPAWCVSPAPGPQHSQRCLSLSGPALQSPVSCLRPGCWPDHTEFLRCVWVSEVSPALWSSVQSSVTSRAQAREHIGTPVQHHQRTISQLTFGDNTPAFIFNKRKCCSIYSRGKYYIMIGNEVKGSSYHALAGKSYSFSLFMLRQFVTFFSHDIPNLSGCQSVRCRPSARLQMSNFCFSVSGQN